MYIMIFTDHSVKPGKKNEDFAKAFWKMSCKFNILAGFIPTAIFCIG